jgi:formate dehydrogenase subunit gamma
MQIDTGAVRDIASAHQDLAGGLLPALHAVQDRFGHVPDAAVPILAEAFNLSRAEVHGVVSYYHHFRREPAGRHVVQVCRAEACQACGAEELLAHAGQLLQGCDVTLEPVYCLGLCATSPALRIDDRLHARVTPQRLQALLSTLAAAR